VAAQTFLRNLAVVKDFNWFFLPPHGRSGGILVGINAETLQVKKFDNRDYTLKYI
jgi:hypothetical protein